jgi:roadblock/LC7 domain-containing protein
MVADNWIAANGAVLDGARTPAYTKLSGAVWNTSSNWAIASNRMSVTDVGAGKSIHVKTAFQDGIVDATIHATAVAAGSLGVLFRYLDTDNFWAFYMAASTGDLYLYRKNAGAGVVVGTGTSTTVTAGLSYDMRVVFAGTQIFAFLDGELIYNYTDATAGNLNRTCHGLYSAGGATGDLHCDSWHFAGWV